MDIFNAIALGLLLVNAVLLITSNRAGLVAYLIFALVAPHFRVGGLIISFELMAFPLVAFSLLLSRKSIRVGWIHLLLIGYFVALTFTTYLSVLRFGVDVEWVRYISYLRYLILLFALGSSLRRKDIALVLVVTLVINMFLSLVQLIVPSSVALFEMLYGKESHAVLSIYSQLGGIPRAVGSFGSPVDLAALCLLGVSVFYSKLISGDHGFSTMLALFAATVSGLTSLTKLFILGLPIVLVVTWFLSRSLGEGWSRSIDVGKVFRRFGVVCVLVVIGFQVTDQLESNGYRISWYLQYLSKPVEAFESRYDRNDGILSSTLDVIADNIAVGVGSTRVENEFVGDSTYVSVLHDVGVLGLLLVVVTAFLMLFGLGRLRDAAGLSLVITLLLTGLAIPSFFALEGCLVVAFALNGREHFPQSFIAITSRSIPNALAH